MKNKEIKKWVKLIYLRKKNVRKLQKQWITILNLLTKNILHRAATKDNRKALLPVFDRINRGTNGILRPLLIQRL